MSRILPKERPSPGHPTVESLAATWIAQAKGNGMSRITVINDSSEFLGVMDDLIAAIGHQMTGFNAVAVSLDEVVASQPVLIVLDLRLENQAQEISGWELLALARAHPALQAVPVILCTAATWEVERRADELAQFADVHIRTKPFAVEEMVTLIQTLVPERKAAPRP